jgi:hypothetical protein
MLTVKAVIQPYKDKIPICTRVMNML